MAFVASEAQENQPSSTNAHIHEIGDQVYYALALKRKDKFGGLVSEPEIRRELLPLAYNPFRPIDAHVNLVPVPIPECIMTPDPPIVVPVDPILTQIPVPLPGGFDCANYESSAEETFKTFSAISMSSSRTCPLAISSKGSSRRPLDPRARVADLFGGMADSVKKLRDTLIGRLECVLSRWKSEVSAQTVTGVEHCSELADLYRGAITHSLAFRPAVPEDALAEIKRLEAGVAAVLEILRTSSIAADNMGLLEMRPIFGAFELEVYREELLHLTTLDEIKQYAAATLTMVIGSSNALEACLRIAEDPVGAFEDLEA
ncbi:hypothetical protein BGZ74_000897 [Mortierella antarctica]|nr:hypothetical protein BGZ74_000897 [Mortierella antarctica]